MFLGPSGAGKTTVVSGARNAVVLGDDQIVIKREGLTIEAHSTPFGRLTDGPAVGRLGGLFLLEQSDRFRLELLDGRELLQMSWEAMPSYTHLLPRTERTHAFDVLHAACSTYPCYRMYFPLNGIDWTAIERAMAAEPFGPA